MNFFTNFFIHFKLFSNFSSTIYYMNVVEICTIIGTVISLAVILYKIGRITSKVDSNTHRLDKHDSDIKDLNDKLFILNHKKK